MIEENIRLTVGIDMDAQQARAISRLLESCAGQLESRLIKREEEK